MPKRKILTGRIYVNDSAEDGLPEKEVPKRDYSSKEFSTEDSFNSDNYTLFAVETVSGKPINNRIYDKNSVKSSIMDGKWNKPFNKRLIKNHNSYGDYTIQGMISGTHFVDLENSSGHFSYDSSSPLPREVIEAVVADNSIGDGCGVVELLPNQDYLNKLVNFDGAIFSQSSYYEKSTCNICNSDYWGGECSHAAGRSYPVNIPGTDLQQSKTCYPIMNGDREPVELSTVVTPANDTSILYIYDKKNKKCYKADSFDLKLLSSEPQAPQNSDSLKDNQTVDSFSKYYQIGVSTDVENNNETEAHENNDNNENKGDVKMITEAQLKLTSKAIDALLCNANDNAKEEVKKMYDKIAADENATEDQLALLVDFAEIVKNVAAVPKETSDKIAEMEERFKKIEDSLKEKEPEVNSDSEKEEEKEASKDQEINKKNVKDFGTTDPKSFII